MKKSARKYPFTLPGATVVHSEAVKAVCGLIARPIFDMLFLYNKCHQV
jgi:hypothetical protein